MSVLKIHMTFQCSAECKHCRLNCTRAPGPAIDFDMVAECIRALKTYNKLRNVVLLGGEPGLFPDLTIALVREIKSLDLDARVETNAFWAVTQEAARNFLAPLYAVGCKVMFSLDAFHEPFIPLDCLENAIRASDELGGKYVVEIPYLSRANRDNDIDNRTTAILREMEQRLGRSPISKIAATSVLFNGRAAKNLAPLVSKGRGIPSEPCLEVPWWPNGSLRTLELLALDLEGYLSKECGIAIGNVRRQSVRQFVETFNAEAHPIFRTLLESGPLGLAREAQEFGYKLKDDYADRCHLCQEARQFLRGKYGEYLVPSQHYL